MLYFQTTTSKDIMLAKLTGVSQVIYGGLFVSLQNGAKIKEEHHFF